MLVTRAVRPAWFAVLLSMLLLSAGAWEGAARPAPPSPSASAAGGSVLDASSSLILRGDVGPDAGAVVEPRIPCPLSLLGRPSSDRVKPGGFSGSRTAAVCTPDVPGRAAAAGRGSRPGGGTVISLYDVLRVYRL